MLKSITVLLIIKHDFHSFSNHNSTKYMANSLYRFQRTNVPTIMIGTGQANSTPTLALLLSTLVASEEYGTTNLKITDSSCEYDAGSSC